MIIGNNWINIKNADTFWLKFKGLMFTKNFDYGLKIKCNGIHTLFMLKPIDVVLTDKNNKVLYIYYNVKPWHIILPKKDVYYTYEFPINSVNEIKVNDILKTL